MITGNAGMLTPYEQGYRDGKQGLMFEQIYTERGEELEADAYKRGFETAYNKFYITIRQDYDRKKISNY